MVLASREVMAKLHSHVDRPLRGGCVQDGLMFD